MPALKKKGFHVDYCDTERKFLDKLSSRKWDVVGIVSNSSFSGTKEDAEEFKMKVLKANEDGTGLFIFGGN